MAAKKTHETRDPRGIKVPFINLDIRNSKNAPPTPK